MSTSKFCIEQRQQEQQQLKKLLIFGFVSSTLLHGIAAYALPYLSVESPQVKKPLELVIVDQPKPKPKPKPPEVKIKPQPKIESKPIVKSEPKPTPQPEAVKAVTPPPPVPKPEPVKAVTPPSPVPKPEPPQPTPKKLLTAPTSASPSSVSVPTSSASDSANNNNDSSSSGVSGEVATNSNNSASSGTESGGESGIACVNNCEPEYPDALEGAEGSAGVKLTIDPTGNVIGAELASADSNSQVNRQALLAARQMEFSSPPGGNAASVQVKINFTVEGSEYDRLARQEQE
ncbi:MAG: hypothetical protein RLZZ499_2977, partial [Cyanobacteriota bacterium]